MRTVESVQGNPLIHGVSDVISSKDGPKRLADDRLRVEQDAAEQARLAEQNSVAVIRDMYLPAKVAWYTAATVLTVDAASSGNPREGLLFGLMAAAAAVVPKFVKKIDRRPQVRQA